MNAPRRLGAARGVAVDCGPDGIPLRVGGRAVEALLEDWLVEDRWWSGRPLRRRYLEVVLAGGRCTVIFRDLGSGRWYVQRG